eukprot:CAMPEP_0194331214 /NCGR_PEP_ID=MMETSP0171-20130528/54733_1 /TAXON_ID=218684 /ORGANISM="Corethron pennatum, Strain L29A3" /LENGTH=1133 /DNA_ID=CAMNT_0039092591 /DNA_START=146 /DNA_END=3544 /DNA_ORIENTATION=+
MVASGKKSDKNAVTAWSHTSEYKKSDHKKSFGDELLEKSFIYCASDTTIPKRNGNTTEGTAPVVTDSVADSWHDTNVLHAAKLAGGPVTSTEPVRIARTEGEKQDRSAVGVPPQVSDAEEMTPSLASKQQVSGTQERSAAGVQPQLSAAQQDAEEMTSSLDSKQQLSREERAPAKHPVQPQLSASQKEAEKMTPSLDSKQRVADEEVVPAQHPVEMIGKEIVCLEENFENTETVLSFALSSDHSSAYDPPKDKIEVEIDAMKKEMDAAKIDSAQTCSQVQSLKGLIVELGKVVEESSEASKSEVQAAEVQRHQELQTSRYACSTLETAVLVLKKDVVHLEEKLGTAVASKREQQMRNDKSIASIIEEKDKVVGRVEVKLTGLVQELYASKKECLAAGSRVTHLTEKISQLENAATKKTAALNIHLKSKQELERFLQKVLQQDKVQFDEETITALSASFTTENLEESLITNQYITSLLKERADSEAQMEAHVAATKKELATSQQGHARTIHHANTLEEKIRRLEQTVANITATSQRHVTAKQELGRLLDTEKRQFEAELKTAQATAVASTAQLEKILRLNTSLSAAMTEKDKVVAQLERTIAGREQEVAASKRELQQAGNHVQKLQGKIAEIDRVVKETTATSKMHLQSKQQLDVVLQEKLKLEEQLKKAQATVLLSSTNLEKSVSSHRSLSAASKEKERALAAMEATIAGMKEEIAAAQKELLQSGKDVKSLQEKIRHSEDVVTELKTTSSTQLKSVQDLQRVQKEEKQRFVKELEQAQAAVAISNAKLEKSVLTHKSTALAMQEKDRAVTAMEGQISAMKKKVDASQRELFETVCQVKTQYDKIAELEKAVLEKTVTSKYLSSNKELAAVLKQEKLQFKEELKRAQLSVLSSSAKLEKTWLANNSASAVLQEKDTKSASMERMIADLEQELAAVEKEVSWMGSIVKNQERTIAAAEKSVTSHAAASTANLKAKQEMELVLKKKIAQLETEVQHAQEAATVAAARVAQQRPTYQTISASLQEREKACVLLKMKIRTLEDKLGASEEDGARTVGQARSLHRQVRDLEQAAEERSCSNFVSSNRHLQSRLESETALQHRTAELERELDATRKSHARATARSERAAEARAAALLAR